MSTPRRYAAFLPDAQALADRRPSPVAGVLLVAVAATIGSLLTWSALAEVEQVVRALGRVEPAGRVRTINHPQGGRVAEIPVREGERVAAGQVLLAFDDEVQRSQSNELRGQFEVRTAEALRLEAEVNDGELVFPAELQEARPDLFEAQSSLLAARRRARANRREALARGVERRQSEIRTLAAEQARLSNSSKLLQQQVSAVQGLAEKGLYPKLKVVAVERQLSDARGDRRKVDAQLEAAQAALAEAEARLAGFDEEWRSDLLAELARVRAERDRIAETMNQEDSQLRGLVLRSPVDGIVQDIAVTSQGESVGSNQPLMKVVPVSSGLVIAARVANEDIGFISVGQAATVKVRAFDFLRFGALFGRVTHIDPDATPDPATGALTYGIEVQTERAYVGDDPQARPVVPGMVVDVDLRVGDRTVLSYLTDRVLHAREDLFRDG